MSIKIAVLGSTGSIGTTTVDIIKKNLKDFKVIFLSTNNNVMKILEHNDIASFDSIGNIFDHNIHEAIAQKSSIEKKGIIIEEFEKGYLYHDKVIRHAKVIVSE